MILTVSTRARSVYMYTGWKRYPVDIELIEKPIETENIEIRNTTART